MKINYISYLNPFHFNGGGEIVMKDLLNYASDIDYDISITSIRPFQNNYQSDADLTILCDIFNEPTLWRKFKLHFLENIIKNDNYIHFDNSYVDVCDLAYLPCNGNINMQCEHKSIFKLKSNIQRKTFSTQCFQTKKLIKKIYENSLLNVFVSPLHHQKISKMICIENRPYFILRPTVDTSKFFNMHINRDIDYLFAGAISEAKGMENLRKYFKNTDKKLFMIGKNIYGKKLSFAEYTGFIDYEQMPKYFNRAKNFIYLPRWPEPQGRVVIEAALCGCNLITNENVGATSFDFDISDKNNLLNVEQEFWKKVKEKLEN